MNSTVVVVGAGTAGLSCAHALSREGFDVVVFEEQRGPGGNVQTVEEYGFRMERGPHAFMSSADDLFDLSNEVGLGSDLISTRPAAGNRFIVRGGRLHRVPDSVTSFLSTRLLSASAKFRLMLEPLRTRRGHPDDTAEQFFTRRFGAEGARVLAGAFISGVYAGDARRLSAPAAFPLFWKFEQEHGGMIRGAFAHAKERRRLRRLTGRPRRRGLYSFRGGLGRLPAALAAGLGRRCRFAQPVKSVIPMERGFRIHGDGPSCEAAAVVVATPPRQAAAVLRDSDRRLADLLAGVPMAPVSTVHLGYGERLERAPEAFGFLAPRNEGVRVLGVLFASRLFEDRAPTQGDLFTAFFGGVLDQAALELADEQLSTIAQKELRRLLGIETPPVYVRTTRYPSAIPQLELGHGARVDEMSRRLANFSGLFLAGNYLRGVGIKDAAASGLEAARSVCDYFRRCSYQDVMAGTPGCPSFPGVSREQ